MGRSLAISTERRNVPNLLASQRSGKSPLARNRDTLKEQTMRVAYIFATPLAHKALSTMILPQIEEGRHGVDVIGMMFFVDNTFFLVKGTDLGERLQKLHEQSGLYLQACDQCTYERNLQDSFIPGAVIGCFPDLYKALASVGGVDLAITL